MKELTNRMCKERDLSVAEKGRHFNGTPMENGTLTAWSKDKYNLIQNEKAKSYLTECAIAFIKAIKGCFSKEEFIRRMEKSGWKVNWSDRRKHITFQNEQGQKVRDSNLSKTFRLDISKEDVYKRQAVTFCTRWETRGFLPWMSTVGSYRISSRETGWRSPCIEKVLRRSM